MKHIVRNLVRILRLECAVLTACGSTETGAMQVPDCRILKKTGNRRIGTSKKQQIQSAAEQQHSIAIFMMAFQKEVTYR